MKADAHDGIRCPTCGTADVRASHHGGMLDLLASLVGCTPFRCRNCRRRFYKRGRRHLEDSSGPRTGTD